MSKTTSNSFLEVIKNSGPGGTLIWKNPEEDFNTNSTLIVAESEEALFFKDGVIEQTFEAGKYQLNTDNYPFIKHLFKKITGGTNAFHCKVYFVRKADTLELLWGTNNPIQLRDPVYNLQTSVKAHGSYSIRVTNSKKFLIKLVGNNINNFSPDNLNAKFKMMFGQNIKSTIARYMMQSKQEILVICAVQDELAEALTPKLSEAFEEYGLEIVNFYIGSIDIPENDPNRQILEKAFARRAELNTLGQDWNRVQSAEILKDLANNQGQAGGIAGLGAGLGMGIASGSAFGQMTQNFSGSLDTPSTTQVIQCPKCDSKNPSGTRFCGECGEKLQTQPKIICSNCKAELPHIAKFCGQCGQKVESKFNCSNCGTELDPGTKFCHNCGQKQS